MTNKKAPITLGANIKYATKLYKKPKSIARGWVSDMAIGFVLAIVFLTFLAWVCGIL